MFLSRNIETGKGDGEEKTTIYRWPDENYHYKLVKRNAYMSMVICCGSSSAYDEEISGTWSPTILTN